MEISLLGLLVLLVVAALIGLVAKAIVGFHYGGLLASIGLGFLGSMLGIWLARVLHLPMLFAVDVAGMTIPILWSLLGAVLLVAIVAFATRSRYYERSYRW